MLPVAIIAFREFLEAFLIVGIFLGVSRKMNLKKEKEILLAALSGIVVSFILAISTYALGDVIKRLFTQERLEIIENLLLLFSGFFLAYVVFSLHEKISRGKHGIIKNAKAKLENQAFDLTLFATIVFLVVREGFEIALFTASTSLFSEFLQNIWGLFTGFAVAALMGTGAFLAYEKFSFKKTLKTTEYMIILLGASMVQVGMTELLEEFSIRLGDILPFGLDFLPDEHSMIGGLLRTFTGVDREFSIARLLIMAVYIAGIYLISGRKKNYSK